MPRWRFGPHSIDFILGNRVSPDLNVAIEKLDQEEIRQFLAKIAARHDTPDSYVVLIKDVSQLHHVQEEVFQLAFADSLTGLANRNRFHQRLDVKSALNRVAAELGKLAHHRPAFNRIFGFGAYVQAQLHLVFTEKLVKQLPTQRGERRERV